MAMPVRRREVRKRQASRDCSDHSSMNPGEAFWLKSPPDCSKEASDAL